MSVSVTFAHRASDWLTIGTDRREHADGSNCTTLRAILFDDRLGPVLIESARGWRAGETGGLHSATWARTLGRSAEVTLAASDRAWLTPRSLSAMTRKHIIPAMHAAIDAERERTLAALRRAVS